MGSPWTLHVNDALWPFVTIWSFGCTTNVGGTRNSKRPCYWNLKGTTINFNSNFKVWIISRMHRRVFQIKFRFLYIFVTKSCFKVPASVMPNEDDWELLSLGPVQAMKSLQGSSTLHFSVLLFFHTKSIFFGVNNPKNYRLCMEINWPGV